MWYSFLVLRLVKILVLLNLLNGKPSHGSDERNWYLKLILILGIIWGILLENILLSGGLV